MRPFCPDGYVQAQDAIVWAAVYWYPEQMAALETAMAGELAINERPYDNVNALTPVEKLARALRGPPSFSEGLRQQILDLLAQTEQRLRNVLHQGALTAFYFGGLFDQGRHAVARDFWATTEAAGVLISGSYWPFGQPRTRHEERASYPLCFLESELAALLSHEPKPPPSNPDVTDVHRGGRREDQDERAGAASKAKSHPGAKSRGIAEAIEKLWPKGLPTGLSAKDRNRAIIKWLEDAGYSLPTNPERAIQRVLKVRPII
jgi:hypothetical protein